MHSPLIVGMTIALLFSLGTCIVQIQIIWVNFACTKGLFNLLAEAIIYVCNVGLCVRCAIFLLKNKRSPFSCRLVKGFTLLKRTQDQFKIMLEMSIVMASIVPTERNANLLLVMLQLRDPFMLVESMVVCSQRSFYVTRARKDDKNRQNIFFFARKRLTWYPTNNY